MCKCSRILPKTRYLFLSFVFFILNLFLAAWEVLQKNFRERVVYFLNSPFLCGVNPKFYDDVEVL